MKKIILFALMIFSALAIQGYGLTINAQSTTSCDFNQCKTEVDLSKYISAPLISNVKSLDLKQLLPKLGNKSNILNIDYSLDGNILTIFGKIKGGTSAYWNMDLEGIATIDPWWNSSFPYCRNITFDNTANSTTLTDFQKLINITNTTGFNPDFSDLRTINDSCSGASSQIELPYFFENIVNSSYAEVLIKVDKILGSSNRIISMYYGNTTATSKSNIKTVATWNIGDDFSDGSLNATLWQVTSGSNYSESGDYLNVSGIGGRTTLKYPSTITQDDPIIIEFRANYKNSASGGGHVGYGTLTGVIDPSQQIIVADSGTGVFARSMIPGGGESEKNLLGNYSNQWHIYRMNISNEGTYRFYVDNDFKIAQGTDVLADSSKYYIDNQGETVSLDWFLLRNYTAQDPSYTISGEYSTPSPAYQMIEETYINPISELETSTFTLKFNVTSNVSTISANLTYNGTVYPGHLTISGINYTFTKSLTSPIVSNDINASFNWSYKVTFANASTYSNTTALHNQTIIAMAVTNCTTPYTMRTLNFTIKNEINSSLVNSNLDAEFIIWKTSPSYSKNYSFNYSGSSSYVYCIKSNITSFNVNSILKYYSTGYSTRYYYLSNTTLSNASQNLTIYILPNDSSNLITITVYDQINNLQSGILVEALKENIGTGTFNLVAEGTTDFQGMTFLNLEAGGIYEFILLDRYGNILNQYQPVLLQTSTLTFYISTVQIPAYFSYYDKVATSCTFNNATNILTCTYIDTSGLSMSMNFNVTQIGIAGSSSKCSEASSNPSGAFVCNLAGNYTYHYSLEGFYYGSNTSFVFQAGTINLGGTGPNFGSVGLFLACIICMFLPMLGMFDMRIAIILEAFGIIFSIFSGLIHLQTDEMAVIFSVAIISGIVAWRIKS